MNQKTVEVPLELVAGLFQYLAQRPWSEVSNAQAIFGLILQEADKKEQEERNTPAPKLAKGKE